MAVSAAAAARALARAGGLGRGDAPPQPKAKVAGTKTLAVRIGPALAIALQLRWRGQDLGLSQAQLGTRLGVSRQQVALLEKPSANLRVTTLLRAAEALDMDLEVGLSPTKVARKRTTAPKAVVSR